MKQARVEHIDIAAGLMLTWMVLGHIASHASYNSAFFSIDKYLSFFMPWFFYKAGLFYTEKPFNKSLLGGAKKLLIPFVVYSLIGQMFYYICLLVENNISFRSFIYQPLRSLFVVECLPGNGALWYLVVLYAINLIAPYLLKRYSPILVALLGVLIAYCCYLLDISWFPCIIPNVAAGLAFYVLGFYMRNKENNWWVLLIAVAVYLVCCIMGYPSIYFHHNTAIDSVTYLLYFPASLAGIIILNNICRIVQPYLKYSLMRWIGQNAMNIYVTHWIVLVILRLVVQDLIKLDNTAQIFTIYMLTMVCVLPLFNIIIKRYKALI